MSFSESLSKTVPVQLPNGAVVKVEVEVASTGREDAGFDTKQFQPVAEAIVEKSRPDPKLWYCCG